ncbi:recombinase family protein [Phycicoccus sp. HDW14]|uniref:recombinase family protein n=1 Tax=Phycicoccus sp. HDW14 TaxID=2714941 RepID=UPI00140E34A9|nr:recombinase family protein [Phycicoccus sp. HDW14]QIM20577.1 recombinase family protein [Phycicoccus sp. HDW14]
MRAAIYARVSRDARKQGRSVAEQVEECTAWAEREGWDVVEVIDETGSASRYARSTGARQRWGELVALVASGRIEVLLTWEHSRALRTLEDYTDLRNLCSKHGVAWGYTGTLYDMTKRDARFRTGLDALLAEDESARTSDRLRRNVRSRAAAGHPHGKLPYGYRREYDATTGALLRQVPDDPRVVDGEEVAGTAPLAREIIERVGHGETLYRIAQDLTLRGVPLPRPARTRHDKAAWLPTTVKRIASNPAYVGLRVHRGEVVGQASWAALVDEATWERAQAALEQMGRGRPRVDRSVKWLLSGIARCGACGGPMIHHVNRGSSTYLCKYCMGVTRVQEPVDELVIDRLLQVLAHLDNEPATDRPSPELTAAVDELAALRARRESFIDQAADGSIAPATLAKVEAKLRPRIEEKERLVRTLRRPSVLSGLDLSDPRALWERLDIGQRRSLLAATLEVTIQPAGRGRRIFDPTLIEVLPAGSARG